MATLLAPWTVLAVGFAVLTALLVVGPRPRVPGASEPAVRSGPPGRVRWLLGGRADAAPFARRLGLGLVGGLAVAAMAARLVDAGAGVWGTAVPVGVGVAVALGWLEPAAARRRRHQLVLQTPQALELLAACLAAGMPVRRACGAVVDAFDGPVAEDLGRVRSLTDLGVADADAWQSLASHPQLGRAAADLARSVESGTLLVERLQHHAARARDQRMATLQVLARSVGVRSVLPLMCCFIPSFVLLGVVPSVASALTHALHF